jgi:hypothetical protein
MKYVGLRKVRWIAFGLAFIGIIQTPFVLRRAVTAISGHRLILVIPFLLAFANRILFIGFMLKIWWDTRACGDAMKVDA